MANEPGTEQQYVLLPGQSLRSGADTREGAREFLRLAVPAQPEEFTFDGRRIRMRVLDSIGADGAKLVELAPEAVLAIRSLQTGLRVVPVVYYTPAVVPPIQILGGFTEEVGKITLRVVSKRDRSPVAGAFVAALTDFSARAGAQGVTNPEGEVNLNLPGSTVELERLYVYPTSGHWSRLEKNLTISPGTQVAVEPLDPGYTDGLRQFYGNPQDSAGSGVTVAVIDTGVAGHADLVVAGGSNTVTDEDPNDYGDNGRGHGTHVAGIVAGRGRPPTGMRGVAPGVTLRSYRVFGRDSGRGTSFAIAKAIDRAVVDGCDLLNLSLSTGQPDDVLKAAVDGARAAGSVCIVAAGNGARAPVSFPASDDMAVAVSAIGRLGTFPADSASVDNVEEPYGSDKADFIAAFSNVGPQIDLTAPGVAIISTLPNGYGEKSGTSMACPAVAGLAARVIASSEGLNHQRDAARSAAIVKAILESATSLGFTPPFQGHGMPRLQGRVDP